jgi:hypothetical protein
MIKPAADYGGYGDCPTATIKKPNHEPIGGSLVEAIL